MTSRAEIRPARRAAVLALAAALGAASTARGAGESCAVCHADVNTLHAQSVHAGEVGCVACHGGDPAKVGLDAHTWPEGGQKALDRKEIPALCATCHADPARMRPYGLPTDQYAQYRTSEHGRLLAGGDPNVAVCTDCHGSHDIARASEPTSRVSPRNVPATCAHCHSDPVRMDRYGVPTDQLAKFQKSVHGVSLFEEEHPSAPTCATCHGAHGAVAPEVGHIANVCGHCHAQTREYFNQSPHRNAVQAGQFSECVSCHGFHDIAGPTTALFRTVCAGCHAPQSPAFRVGEKLETLLERAGESLAHATAELARAETRSPGVAAQRSRLLQARAYHLEALPAQHALDVDRVEDLTRQARSIAEEVLSVVHGLEEETHLRYVIVALAWCAILFLAAVAWLYGQERRRERAGEREAPGP